ncbi:MAG: 2'-5' RNA ligase family protein [Devosia sp.]
MQVNEQLRFNGGFDRFPRFVAPPVPSFHGPIDPVFFALQPDEEATRRIARQAEWEKVEYGLAGRLIPAERLHVTLQWVPVPRGAVEWFAAIARFIALDIGIPPFEVTFDDVLSFRKKEGNRPIVLRGGTGELMGLFQILGEGMRRLGFGEFARRAFTPHITMLYDRREVPAHAVEPITWTVREFELIHSLQGQGHHSVVGRWPLQG